MNQPVPCFHLGRELSSCWSRAEDRVVNEVRQRHFGPDEPSITFLLRGHLRDTVAEASAERKFEFALRSDLAHAFADLPHDHRLAALPSGLVATVSFHDTHHEGHSSGADIGLVVRRPVISRSPFSNHQIRVQRAYARALLAQAKLGRVDRRGLHPAWRRLTKAQCKIAPARLEYYSLLLYRILDPAGTTLAPFSWQLCSGYGIVDLKRWLQTGTFPCEKTSVHIVEELSLGRIGTDNDSIVAHVAAPAGRSWSSIDIKIDWPDDRAPPPAIEVPRTHDVLSRQVLTIRH
ncbi:MAG TPA: hypothetical protein VES67_15085 [Vicinamibacterales bacterium]|nr:hypothetical protein [Vicinamibacterales bacterium]